MRAKNAACLFLTLLLVPLALFGQADVTGRITGKVTDDQGAPLAGATVEVTSEDLKLQRQATTGANGEFLFALLPTGSYTVVVTALGRQPQVITLRLGIGQTVPLDVPLAPGENLLEIRAALTDGTAWSERRVVRHATAPDAAQGAQDSQDAQDAARAPRHPRGGRSDPPMLQPGHDARPVALVLGVARIEPKFPVSRPCGGALDGYIN